MKHAMLCLVILVGLASGPGFAYAAALPLQGVDILVKSQLSKWVTDTQTDANGNFTMHVIEPIGMYNVYISDESNPPVVIQAKNNVVSGRVVILTGNTVAEEPAVAAVESMAAKAPVVPANACPKVAPLASAKASQVNDVPFLLRPISSDGTTLDGTAMVHLISLP